MASLMVDDEYDHVISVVDGGVVIPAFALSPSDARELQRELREYDRVRASVPPSVRVC